jgi:hypothetical protein
VDAISAYLFALPLVLENVTCTLGFKTNTLYNIREFPKAGNDSDVIRENVDTLYTHAFLDLDVVGQAMALTVPDTKGRYFEFQMMDAWTSTFASPSSRVNGTGGGTWAVTAPGWKGKLPEGIAQIASPTRHVWVIGRTMVFGVADLPNVHALQDQYKLANLAFESRAAVNVKSSQLPIPQRHHTTVDTPGLKPDPPDIVAAMNAETFFGLALDIMAAGDLPVPADPNIDAVFTALHMPIASPLDWANVPLETKLLLDDSGALARAGVEAAGSIVGTRINGWDIPPMDLGDYGTDYKVRVGPRV